MDSEKLKALGDAIGMTLYKRDNRQLERDTLDKLVDTQYDKLCRKQQATRNAGVVSEAESVDKFYSRGNSKD
ncbi:hypothetical protein [Vibrio phage LP.2]|nr:hypothetical protein [Vibrio phage LP.2]